MVDLQTGASKSTTLKEKASVLNEDIGKKILGSWKSMSVTEDDAMDFNFETMPKDKKNKFNFDKLDMDFNMDGEFEKMASFKVDMADLDFSSPQKKNSKPKEKSEEESSSGESPGKQNRFAFSFDFNELDDFNFDSSLTEGNKKSKFSESQKHTADISNNQGSNVDHMTTSKADNLISVPEILQSPPAKTSRDNLPAKTSRDNLPAKSSIFENIAVPHGVRNTSERTTIIRDEKTHHQSQELEKTISTVPSGQQTIINEPVQSVSSKTFTLATVTKEVQAEVGLLNSRFNNDSSGEQNAGTKLISDSVSKYKSVKMNNASTLHVEEPLSNNSERSKMAFNSHVSSKSTSDSEPAQGDMDSEDTSTTRAPRRMLCDATTSRENQTTSKIPVVMLSRENNEAMVEKLTTKKEQDIGVIRSRFFEKSEDTECQLLQASSTQAQNVLSENNITCTVRSSLVNKNREISNDNAAQIGNNVVGGSSAQAGGSTAEETIFLGTGNSRSNSNKTSCQVNPSSTVMEQTNKSNMQKSVNLKLGAPTMASLKKSMSVERNNISSFKVARTPDLSTLNISGSIGAKKAISNLTLQKACKSVKTSELNMKIHESTASKITHTTVTEKRAPVTPPVKRKTCETSNKDLVELKRLKGLSPVREIRYRGIEASESVIQEQLCNHENQVSTKINIKNSFCGPSTTTIDFPPELHMTDLEIPLIMESGIVEKAEAYTKELEDICNMLKKKHEEAKELLVRAVVSNNNLLMLNHPIYEEKIRTVQKMAARLTQKAIHIRSPTATCRS